MSTAAAPDYPTVTPAGNPMTPRIARVTRRRRDGPLEVTLDIEAADGAPFAPGQFNMLTAFGVGEVPVSMSGDPAAPHRLAHTIRAIGPVTTALARLAPGDLLGLRGPFGVPWPIEEATGRDVVIVAGGLGLAPLRPALYRLLAGRERYGGVSLLYGTRGPAEILFRRELETWRRRLDIDIEVTVDHAPAGWRGHVGVVTRLVARADFDPPNATAFVCGPELMMRFTIAALKQAGVADEAIHLSIERNMKCAVGHCGRCQLGPALVCRDGPVFRYDRLRGFLNLREL